MNARELLQHTFPWEHAPGVPAVEEPERALVDADAVVEPTG